MIAAVVKMGTQGVAGRLLYAGEAGDAQSARYGLANVAAFIAQSMQETIQYDACDENNWSNGAVVGRVGGVEYPATSACGQLGQSYEDYKCTDIVDPATGETVKAEDMQCEVDPNMVAVAETHATWYGAPPPLFCAPRSIVKEAPRWDYGGWCPSSGTSWNQDDTWAAPFDTKSRGDIYYSAQLSHVPPEVLAAKPTYLDYLNGAIDKGTGEACLMKGECCMDVSNQRAGSWKSCSGGGCANADANRAVSGKARTDVEGCCWWGRGVIQTTGVCNFGKLNYFLGKKAAQRGAAPLYPSVDFCRDPGAICRKDHPDLKWVAGLFYWLESVQPYEMHGGNYMRTLRAWVDAGADPRDHSLIDMASGIVNRGCHDAPHEGDTGPDICGNGVVDAVEERRRNFVKVVDAMKAAGVWSSPQSTGRRHLVTTGRLSLALGKLTILESKTSDTASK